MNAQSIIDEGIKALLDLAKANLKDASSNIQSMIADFLASKKDRLAEIAQDRLENKIDDGFMKIALSNELYILKDELLAVAVATESDLEALINKMTDTLQTVILDNLSGNIKA